MATNKQQTTNYKRVFRGVLFISLIWVCWWGYYKSLNYKLEYDISSKQWKVEEMKKELAWYSEKPWFQKLQYVQNLENSNNMMPWSDHVRAIMAIFDDLLAVDNSDTFNIEFSNFEISLEHIRLDWRVSNLSILYRGANSNTGLIARFEELDFLNNISIKTYEKSTEKLGYKFTLTANVTNNGK